SSCFDPFLESLHSPPGAHHAPRLFRTDAIQRSLWTIDGDIDRWVRHCVVRISIGIPPIEELRHDVSVLPTKKLSPIIVETHTVLPFARFDSQHHRPRIESKIALERDRFYGGIVEIGNDPGEAVDQAVNPVVEAPIQTAEHALGIKSASAVSPAREDDLL